MLLRFLTFNLLLVTASSSYADLEFGDSIPTNTILALFSPADEDVAIYSDIAQAFPRFDTPSEFSIIGSLDWDYFVRVLFGTTLDKLDALDSIRSALTDVGWISLSPRLSRVNYASGTVTLPDLELCLDEYGIVNINYFARSDLNVISLFLSSYQQDKTCEEHIADRASPPSAAQSNQLAQQQAQEIGRHIPDIEISGQQSRGVFGQGFAPNGNTATTRRSITSEMFATEIYGQASEQLQNQGWEREMQALGRVSSSGNWTKIIDNGFQLSGMLTVVKTEQSRLELAFQIIFPMELISPSN